MVALFRNRSTFAKVLTIALACASSTAAHAKDLQPAVRDSAAVVAADRLVEAAGVWCERESPAEGAKLRAAHAQWRQRHGVDAVRARLAATAPTAAAPMSSDDARRIGERMAAEGKPAKTCLQMMSMLGTADMNLRERYPAAYADASAASGAQAAAPGVPAAPAQPARPPVPTPAPALAPKPAPAKPPTAAVPPGTLLVNPAQLSAMVDRVPYVKDRTPTQRLEAAGLAGTIAIKGRVVSRGENRFYLEHQEEGFRSKLSVSPGVSLKEYEGRDVIVAGRLDEWPSALVFLRDSRVIDGRGLKASSEPTAPGMFRIQVEAERIRTAPGKGVSTGDVHGVLYHGRGATGSNGLFTFKEDVTVLLRDGWAYSRIDVPPSDVNLKASRELEPQRWGKWRRAGGGFEIRWQDDHGRPRGDWQKAEGRLVEPWPSGTRLAGVYTSAAFHGSIALGGMYVKNTHVFAKDGTYEDSRFSQAGSGSMAATNGFSSQATSHSNKTGTTSVAGTTASTDSSGAMTSSGSPSMAVTSRSNRDDGSQHRGRYTIDGYTLEIRRDNGRVDRLLTFKSLSEGIWIGDRTFSLPSKN